MPDNSHNSLDLLIAELVDYNRPQNQPPFEALLVRWRRRRVIRRGSAVAAVALIAAAVAVPSVLVDRPDRRHPLPPGVTFSRQRTATSAARTARGQPSSSGSLSTKRCPWQRSAG